MWTLGSWAVSSRTSFSSARSRNPTRMGYQLIKITDRRFTLSIAAAIAILFSTRDELFRNLAELYDRMDDADADLAVENARLPYAQMSRGAVVRREDPLVVNLLQSGPRRQVRSKSLELTYDIRTVSRPRMYFPFSATRRDRRIQPNGDFTPGTYATTFSDLRMVASGLAAVGRYALPSPYSAPFTYSIVTQSMYRMGTSLPNFGQSGGGIEVCFHSGAAALHDQPHEIDMG